MAASAEDILDRINNGETICAGCNRPDVQCDDCQAYETILALSDELNEIIENAAKRILQSATFIPEI